MMNELIKKLWEKIDSAQSIYAIEYKAIGTDVIAESGKEILIAIDNQNEFRHLIIPINKGEKFKDDDYSRGVNIIYQKIKTKTEELNFIDVLCKLPHLNELFTIIISEILEEIENDNKEPYKKCKIVIERWRELLSKSYPRRLSAEKLQGVFGELWYLRELSDIDLNAIDYWIGPLGDPHDFSNGKIALEVKTTTKKARMFWINGVNQLTPPEDGVLYLCAIKLEKVKSGGESVPDIIESLKEIGLNYAKLLSLLVELGYSINDNKFYENFRYQIKENRVYFVNDHFPRITNDSFKGGNLPKNVIDIVYQIDINSEPPIPISDMKVSQILRDFCSIFE